LRSGDDAHARDLATEELRLAEAWGAPLPIGIATRTLGRTIGGQRGLELLARSAEIFKKSGLRLEHARSLVEQGAALRRDGRRTEARELLTRGADLADACGAAALTTEALQELRATGARPRRIAQTGINALTPSELRVARLAADGLTNRDIAQALFVTLRTVEVHLTHCYQKLGISARDQLPTALSTGSQD
jgi:DNA-binding CsgD family transcriptional regulator